jgi:hypothetical protein
MDTAMSYETWFIVLPGRDCWVRVEAAGKDEVRAFAVHRYGTDWVELIPDVEFNPDLYRGWETEAFRVEFRTEPL